MPTLSSSDFLGGGTATPVNSSGSSGASLSSNDFLAGGTATPAVPGQTTQPQVSARQANINAGLPVSVNSQNANPSFLGGLLRAPVKLAARAATNLVNAGQVLLGKPQTQPFSGTYLGKVTGIGSNGTGSDPYAFSGKNLEDSVGAGLEAGSYLVGGEGAGAVVDSSLTGLLKEAAIQGAKSGATAGVLGGAGGAMQQGQGIGGVAKSAAIGGVVGGVTGGVLGTGGALAGKAANALNPSEASIAQGDLQKINETISPKPTPTQAKLAETQGRLYAGKSPTLLKAGTAPKIATPNSQFSSVLTINRLIPDAAKMDEPTLYQALDNKISDVAENLKPAMQKTPITPSTIEKLNNDWQAVKKTQLDNADVVYKPDGSIAPDPNIIKSQNQFESILKNSGNKTMNDLWEARKAYDASIPNNVKNATSLSDARLQAKQEIWKQNRDILNNALNDSGNGLEGQSQKAFSDMKDMYNAQKGILSKASATTKPLPSKLNQALESPTGKIVKGALLGGSILEGGKKLVTGKF